jgi:hypothetical protein
MLQFIGFDVLSPNIVFGPVRLPPRMAERGYGRVVSIASVHGLVPRSTKRPMWRASSGWSA